MDDNGEMVRFLTNHCSVYILYAQDDYKFYHTAEYPPCADKKISANDVRIALTLRWTGYKAEFCDGRVKKPLMHGMIVDNPEECLTDDEKIAWKDILRSQYSGINAM